MADFLHILDRFVIHFFSSCGLVLGILFVIQMLARKVNSPFLSKDWKIQLRDAALVVFAFSTLREAYDVAKGQSLIKAFMDYASWLSGCGFSTWGLYRFKNSQ